MHRPHLTRPGRAAATLSAAALSATAFLTACGTSGPSTSAGTTSAQGTITMWMLNDQNVLEDAVTAYNKDHPSEKIVLDLFSNEAYPQKLDVAFGANKGPDIYFNWGGGALDDFVKAGKVTAIPSSTVPTSRFSSSVMGAATFNGQVYGIPANGIAPVVLYYNKKVLSSAGLTPPSTFAQLLADVSKLKAKGVTPISLAASDEWPTLMYIEYLVDRVGGSQVFDSVTSGNASAWTSPAITKANQLLQTLYSGGAFGSNANSIAYGNGTSTALLYTGKAAFELMGTWEYANVEKADPGFISSGELGYTSFPTVSGGAGNPDDIAGNLSNFLSVNADVSAAKKAAIMTFLKDYVLDSSQVDEYLATGSVPPVNALGPKIGALDSSQKPWLEFIYGLVQKAPSFQLSWDQELPSSEGTPLLTNVGKSLLGQISPASFGENMSKAG